MVTSFQACALSIGCHHRYCRHAGYRAGGSPYLPQFLFTVCGWGGHCHPRSVDEEVGFQEYGVDTNVSSVLGGQGRNPASANLQLREVNFSALEVLNLCYGTITEPGGREVVKMQRAKCYAWHIAFNKYQQVFLLFLTPKPMILTAGLPLVRTGTSIPEQGTSMHLPLLFYILP